MKTPRLTALLLALVATVACVAAVERGRWQIATAMAICAVAMAINIAASGSRPRAAEMTLHSCPSCDCANDQRPPRKGQQEKPMEEGA